MRHGRTRDDADVEVLIVGAGPAGSALATLLAEAGRDVLVVDKARFPRHKACSEYVNPAGAAILEALGVGEAVQAAGAHRLTAMVVHAPGDRRFRVDYAAACPGRTALGLSRWRLDQLLLERAEAAGATIRQGGHVRDVIVDGGRARGVEATLDGARQTIRARLVVGADGRHSAVTRALGLDAPIRWPARTGMVAHYRGVRGLESHGELHVGRNSYAGLAPLEDGVTNVAFVTGADAVAQRGCPLEQFFEDGLAALPGVGERLAGTERIGAIRGIGPLAHRARRATGDGFVLVGDAASFLDPFTGDGIYEALRGAQLAAPVINRALREGTPTAAALAPYAAARRRTFATKRAVCWIIQGFIHVPLLMGYVTPRLDQREDLGRTLTGVVGNIRPAHEVLSPWFLARLLRP